MLAAPIPDDDEPRLEALRRYRILDSVPEAAFDDLTRVAAALMDTPIALVSLVDADRQWFKSRHGLEVEQTPRDVSFCGHAVASRGMLVVPDASRDWRFADNPLVVGDPRVAFYAGAPLLTADGWVLGTLCVIDRVPRDPRDDTLDLLAALGRQVMRQIELRLTVLEQERTIAAQRRLERSKDEFVSIINHEIRTPLTSISGALDLLDGGVAGDLPERAVTLISVARTNAGRLRRLIDQMLDLDRLASGGVELGLQPLDVAELVSEAVRLNRTFAGTRRVEVRFDDHTPGVRVLADRDRVLEILDNLLSNAIKHSPEGRQVEVSARAAAGAARVDVADRGPGVPPGIRDRIFERFVRGDGVGGTTGLGLHIAKRLVEAHGGTIGFSARPGGGTVFGFTLPLADD